MLCLTFSLLALVASTVAHFSVQYPYWRGDSYETQWDRPCGGVNQAESDKNRTEWPLDGGSVVFKGSHAWAFTFVNLGLGGDNTTVFNYTLVEGFNQTSNGTFCFPKVNLPSGLEVSNGTTASVQVIQVNEHGSALYNCADITFSDKAEPLDDKACFNSTGVGGSALSSEDSTASSSGSGTSTASAAGSTGTSGSNKVATGAGPLVLAGLATFAYLLS